MGLGYSRLSSWKRVSGAAGRHRLVLQWTLAALVAHGAVERVVDEQQLHDPLLRLLGDRRGELGADHHAVGHRLGARGDRLALALDLDQALPAGAGRLEQRVVAEARDLDADPLGHPDEQLALGRGHLDPVDGERDRVRRGGLGLDDVATSSVRPYQLLGGQLRWRAALDVVQVVLLEVLQRRGHRAGRAVAETAERPAENVVAGVEQRVQVLVRCPGRTGSAGRCAPSSSCPRGTACTCRTTRGGRTPATGRSRRPGSPGRRRSASRWCRGSTRPPPRPRSPAVRRGAPR